jgi:hypothetical protein
MKNLLLNSAVLMLLTLTGCDKVTTPIQKNDVTPDSTTKQYRKIVLEDHTGNRCPNCPAAAAETEMLKAQYGKNIIIIGEHSAFLSSKANEAAPFNYTLQNAASEKFYTDFDIDEFGKPYGVINRLGYKQKTMAYRYDKWAEQVNKLINTEADATIELKTTYDSVTHKLKINVVCEFLKNQANATYNLSVFIIEHNIVGAQLKTGAPGGIIPDYTHQHVLRHAIIGPYGEVIVDGTSITSGEKYTKSYQVTLTDIVTSKPLINDKNLSVVAFIHNADFNADNYREIIQAEEVIVK